MALAKKFNLGGVTLPLDIDALETLPVPSGGIIQFDFTYRQIRFACRYQHDDAGGILRLAGDVGPLPFTAESPAARAGLGQIVLEANDVLGTTFRLSQSRILVAGAAPVAQPLTATNVVAAAATILVPVAPYLDLIATYIRPPMAPARPGESALRPEWRRRPLPKPTGRR
ncbi:MAG TPA: hypothetical protein VK196_06740 [Magnetospirillum sp.]|nr:hypothetical protein [Magnetospirillum sp.]